MYRKKRSGGGVVQKEDTRKKMPPKSGTGGLTMDEWRIGKMTAKNIKTMQTDIDTVRDEVGDRND